MTGDGGRLHPASRVIGGALALLLALAAWRLSHQAAQFWKDEHRVIWPLIYLVGLICVLTALVAYAVVTGRRPGDSKM